MINRYIKIQDQYRNRLTASIVKTVKPLARLLKEKKLFMPFFRNVENNGYYTYHPQRNAVINVYNELCRIIDLSFTWSETKEGHGTWSDINQQWQFSAARLNYQEMEKYVNDIIDAAKRKYNATETNKTC